MTAHNFSHLIFDNKQVGEKTALLAEGTGKSACPHREE